jgi:hypothetical protein
VRIERELDRLVKPIKDGVPASRVKDKMADLESNKAEIEARLKDAAENPVLIHPNMAPSEARRDLSAAGRAAARGTELRTEAAEALRALIDQIRLIPENDRLEIELCGDLAASGRCWPQKPKGRW